MEVGFAGAFLGGLAALLSPCAAMLLPSFFAYAFGEDRRRLIARTCAFYLGLLLPLVPLGLGVGALGSLLTEHRGTLALVGGLVMILFGVVTLLGLQLPVPGVSSSGGTSTVAVVLMGAVYGLAGACTGPLLGAVLTFAAVGGSAFYGALLMMMFGAGMVTPLLLLAWVWDELGITRWLRPRPVRMGPVNTSLWNLISGILLIGIGCLFLFSDATSALGGLLDARQQFDLENWLRRFAGGIPDAVAILILLAGAGAVIWWVSRRSSR